MPNPRRICGNCEMWLKMSLTQPMGMGLAFHSRQRRMPYTRLRIMLSPERCTSSGMVNHGPMMARPEATWRASRARPVRGNLKVIQKERCLAIEMEIVELGTLFEQVHHGVHLVHEPTAVALK